MKRLWNQLIIAILALAILAPAGSLLAADPPFKSVGTPAATDAPKEQKQKKHKKKKHKNKKKHHKKKHHKRKHHRKHHKKKHPTSQPAAKQ
jgi:hypothetical protein